MLSVETRGMATTTNASTTTTATSLCSWDGKWRYSEGNNGTETWRMRTTTNDEADNEDMQGTKTPPSLCVLRVGGLFVASFFFVNYLPNLCLIDI